MSKTLLSLILLMVSSYAFCQDTIFVSDKYKSYLLFDEVVSLADVGNPLSFQVHIEDKTVMLVAANKQQAATPFFAVVEGKAFTAMLVFMDAAQPFYDFRHSMYKGDQAAGYKNVLEEERLEFLEKQPDMYYASDKTHGVHFQLAGLLHDHGATYLKFKVTNHSSLIYRTDHIGFERRKVYKKGFFAREQQAHFPLYPQSKGRLEEIMPYSSGYLYYVLPLQALEEKETLIATLREKEGRRSVSIDTPYRRIRKADLY
jgi:hypothetical protein